MKTVRDLLDVLKKLPPDSEIADNHLGDIYIEDWKGNHYFIRNGKRCPL